VHEGGQGLSGGQRQLVNLTRVFLRRPRLWLLDEPTASMDRNLEAQVIRALHTSLRPDDVLVLVTHKPELLQLVDRLIVVAGNQIVLDGPKADVLAKLQQPRPTTETPAS
jgi:ATP-binding cassette subfamily C protein LapB